MGYEPVSHDMLDWLSHTETWLHGGGCGWKRGWPGSRPVLASEAHMDVKGLGHGRKTKWGPVLVSDSPKVTVGTQRSLIKASLLE